MTPRATERTSRHVERPPSSRLQIFAFDPSLAIRLETATLNELTLEVPWEEVTPGPTGEYLEVIDVDPASGVCYQPINLNDAALLAGRGPRLRVQPRRGSRRG